MATQPKPRQVASEEPQTFPEPPTPLAEQPILAAPDLAYYRILHDLVGSYPKDTIVELVDLGGSESVERLLKIGAVAPL